MCSAHRGYERECPRCQSEKPDWVIALEQAKADAERERDEALGKVKSQLAWAQTVFDLEKRLDAAEVRATNANTRILQLEAQLAAAVQERDEALSKLPYAEASGHYCDGMTAAWSDAQAEGVKAQRYREALEAIANVPRVSTPRVVIIGIAQDALADAAETGEIVDG